jgi:putative transposase
LAQQGTKAYEEAFDLLYQRDATTPNEIWQADHSPLPILVLNEKGEPQRPWLTVIEDDYSRAIAGFNITFRPPCAINTSLALRQAIWHKSDPRWHLCGIPESFYTDHGSDFTSRHMEQVAAELHIELIFSLVGKPRGRGRIERFFRSVEQLLLVELPGFAPEGNPLTPPKLTLAAFTDIFREWLLNAYHLRKHGGTGQLPQAMWESNGFLANLPSELEQLDLLLTFAATRIVNQEGIRFNKYWYKDLTLSAYVGETVTIRYDPEDIAELRVYYKEHFLCRAVSFELAGATISLQDVIRARNRRKRELRQIIQERQILVETYLNAHQGYSDSSILPESEASEQNLPSPEPARKPKLKRYFNE